MQAPEVTATATHRLPAELRARIDFVVETARRLHQYGTAAPRLESAIDKLAARLDLSAQVWSSPTALIVSFAEGRDALRGLADITQVMRLPPGELDLSRLTQVNEIADAVIAGKLGIAEGSHRLHAIRDGRSARARVREVACYGVVSAALAALLHSAWVDLAAAGGIGVVVGLVADISGRSTRLRMALEAICALLATLLATLASVYLTPLNLKPVVLASLIVLLPGMSLTTAARELSTEHLVSGAARFAGAITTLIKLAFGTIVANELCKALQLVPPASSQMPVPAWAEWVALGFACYAFAVLFRAARRDFPLVMAAAGLGYLITYYGGHRFTPELGVFLAGLCMGALGNLYARNTDRPGALVREPGIILLVPGSVGYRSLSLIAERDVFLGIDTAISLVAILACLVAGLLFGDLLVAPKRAL